MGEDYQDFSEKDLSDELVQLDKDIEYWQTAMASNRRLRDKAMEAREDVIEELKLRSQHRGWRKND